MGITKRFINIVKTNRKDFDNTNLSEAEIKDLLKDDSDDELSKMIEEAGKNYLPKDIVDAFFLMEIKPTKDLKLVSLQFKNLLNKYHPDKNSLDNKLFSNEKTTEIITAYNTIKNYLENK